MILRFLSAFYGGMKSVSSGFYFNWGMTYARWGQPMKAMFYLNRAAKLNDKGAHIFYQRALLLIAMGRPESAIYDFNAAIAAAYAATGQDEKARAAMKTFLGKHPGRTIATYQHPRLYKRKDDLDRYLNLLRKAGMPE